jgi:hypothetical protein
MTSLVTHYLAAARQFERLARIETCPEAKQLLNGQAETCLRLAFKRAKAADRALSLPPPVDFIA